MQSRRRCGDAAIVLRIDGLVTLTVVGSWCAPDIRRQRHFTVARERPPGVELPDEAHPSQPPSLYFDDLDHAVLTDGDPTAGFQLSSRMPHREPRAIGKLTDKQQLRRRSRRPRPPSPFPRPPNFPCPPESCGYDARLVDDEHIRRGEEIEDRRELRMANRAARTLKHEQATGRAVGQGILGDLLRRECVVEI